MARLARLVIPGLGASYPGTVRRRWVAARTLGRAPPLRRHHPCSAPTHRSFLARPFRLGRHGRGSPRGRVALRVAQSRASAPRRPRARLALVEHACPSHRQGRWNHRTCSHSPALPALRGLACPRTGREHVRASTRRRKHRQAAWRRSIPGSHRALDKPWSQAGQTRP
jgi:hypothetical protein